MLTLFTLDCSINLLYPCIDHKLISLPSYWKENCHCCRRDWGGTEGSGEGVCVRGVSGESVFRTNTLLQPVVFYCERSIKSRQVNGCNLSHLY